MKGHRTLVTQHFVSRHKVAVALGMTPAAIQQRHNAGTMPQPDAILHGSKGSEWFGWKRETIEEWAPKIGRTADWTRSAT